jgi:hypothetical protein
MLSAKYMAMTIAVMFAVLAGSSSAQWSPGGMMVYMGDLNLAASSASGAKAVQPLGGSEEASVAMNGTLNSSLENATLINGTLIDNSTMISPYGIVPSSDLVQPSGKQVLDLSGYGTDRSNKNLAGYKNIMYPISGSRGSTTSTASGGGCGCG